MSILFGILTIVTVIAVDQPVFGQVAGTTASPSLDQIATCNNIGGAQIELDKKVYAPNDIVSITITVPSCNTDPNVIDVIGDGTLGTITISTNNNSITNYKLVETGVNTGVFTGKVILSENGQTSTSAKGPTDGILNTSSQYGISVAFTRTGWTGTVTGSALIRTIMPPTLPPLIAVNIDKPSYTLGDTIVISGQVQSVVVGTPLTIQILDPTNNLVLTSQVDVPNNGQYSDSVIITGALWKTSGIYTVKVQYGPIAAAQTNFTFQSSVIPTNNVFQLKDPNSQQTFNVDYTMSGGTVKTMTINAQSLSVIVSIDSTSDGTITLQLPRALIDAKTSSGQDGTFIILIDGAQVKPQSESSDNNFRNITIQFLHGDQNISIIGTQTVSSTSPQPTPSSQITITTDKSSYNDGDTIVISGKVQGNILSGVLMGITIVTPSDNVVLADQLIVGSDGTFSKTLTATGSLWADSGTYQIVVQYGSQNRTPEATFQFSGSNGVPPLTPPANEIDMTVGAGGSRACVATNNCFSPNTLSVAPGTTVTWKNTDTVSHYVTSGNPSDATTGTTFDSGNLIKPGSTYQFTFANAGTYGYFCTVHPWMTGQVIVGTVSQPTPTSQITVTTDKSTYNGGDLVAISTHLQNAPDDQTVAILVTDPSGNVLASRTISYSQYSNTLQVGLPQSAPSGTYKVTVTASVYGSTKTASTLFMVASSSNPAPQVTILSVQPTNQQGDPISSFGKGTTEYAMVILSSGSSQSALVTVNLVDAQSTSLGVGTVQTTLGAGQSKMVVSFYIPSDAVSGTANIYADTYSDWPSNGGTPLGGESSSVVTIR